MTSSTISAVTGYRPQPNENKQTPSLNSLKERDLGKKEQIKEVFDKLLITEYYLPTAEEEKLPSTSINTPHLFVAPFLSALRGRVLSNSLDKTKKEIQKATDVIKNAINAQTPLPNIILIGLPAAGNRTLGEDLCHKHGIGFIRIPSEAMEHHIKAGSHLEVFNEAVKMAKDCPAPTYIIMDKSDELIAQEPKSKQANTKIDSQIPELDIQNQPSETNKERRTALVNAILDESGKSNQKLGFCITTDRFNVIDSAFKNRARIVHPLFRPNIRTWTVVNTPPHKGGGF